MKFELNEYHRNISNEEFLNDLKNTAQKLGKNTLTIDEYTANGEYHSSTIIRRFGSWKRVLELSGLEVKGHNFHCEYSLEEVITDIKKVAKHLGKDSITQKEYDENGCYSSSTIVKKHGPWNRLVKMAGLNPVVNNNFCDNDLLYEIERVWISLGRQPTSTDIKSGVSKYSLQSYSRRFGGWRGALSAFIDWVNDDNSEAKEKRIEDTSPDKNLTKPLKEPINNVRKTQRDINLRLRFRVLQRDNFKCCACGASPAKDPSVILHVDHIIPWSKGGETVLDNLQTLCSDCNLGKADIL